MLSGGVLDGKTITVAKTLEEATAASAAPVAESVSATPVEAGEIEQEDKPHS
jgi:hypothetical protein